MTTVLRFKPRSAELFEPVTRLERLVAALGSNVVAELLGVSKSQPGRWRRGMDGISPANQERIVDLDHVLTRLLQALHPEQAADWLTTSNPHLGGARPVDALQLRGSVAVVAAIDALAEGAYA